MSKDSDSLLTELAELVEKHDTIIAVRTLRGLVEKYTPTPPIEEPMKVGARVVSVNGRLFERFRRGTGQDYRDWWRFGSSAAFRWSEIVVEKVVFEGYDT